MNKFVLSIVMVAVVAIALGTTSLVSAQSPTPQSTVPGTGTGMMNGRGGRGMMQPAPASQDGLLHDGMIAAYAEALNIIGRRPEYQAGEWRNDGPDRFIGRPYRRTISEPE